MKEHILTVNKRYQIVSNFNIFPSRHHMFKHTVCVRSRHSLECMMKLMERTHQEGSGRKNESNIVV